MNGQEENHIKSESAQSASLPIGTNTNEWRKIPSFPDYEIFGDGTIRRLSKARGTRVGRIKKPFLHEGYLMVSLMEKGKLKNKTVHILLCEAFIGTRPINMPQINHKDGNKLNNDLSNLEYCTALHNIQHAWDLKLNTPKKQDGPLNPRWGGGKKDYACKFCGKLVKRHEIGNKRYTHNFCSLPCLWAHNRGKSMKERKMP